MTLPSSPIREAKRSDALPSSGFKITLKVWMGRILSYLTSLSHRLYSLIDKTEKVATPILKDLSEIPSSPVIPLDLNDPTPLEESEEEVSIVDSLFKNLGFESSIHEIMAKGDLFTSTGQKPENVDKKSLTGEYQIEWKLEDGEVFIYKGGFKKGIFHGSGYFFIENPHGANHILIDGNFEEGKLVSGLFVLDNCYVNGQFHKGLQSGQGTIHYLEGTPQMEYRGTFKNAAPHGKGKMFVLSPQGGLELVGNGEFRHGHPFKGTFLLNGQLYDGEFNQDEKIFKGKVINKANKTLYEGELKKDLYEGQGKLIEIRTYRYDQLVSVESDETAIFEKDLEGEVSCTAIGEFKKGKFFRGENQLKWPDKKIIIESQGEEDWLDCGVIKFDNFEITHMELTTFNKTLFSGDFEFGTLDGTGSIYNSDKLEVYSGEIKCGFPHGQGVRTNLLDGTKQEGTFEWGQFQATP